MKMKSLILAVAAVLMVIGIGVTVGGWITNKDQVTTETEVSTEEERETEVVEAESEEEETQEKEQDKPEKEEETKASDRGNGKNTDVTTVDKITFNTDEPLSNLWIQIADYVGEYMILEVINESDVCYDYVMAGIYFLCGPVLDQRPTDREYYNGHTLRNIPAYSVTYHLVPALRTIMGKEGEGGYQGYAYYPFKLRENPYRIVPGEDGAYRISETLLQNAMDYITVDQSTEDFSVNKVGTASNHADRHIEFTAYAYINGRELVSIQNGNRHPNNKHKDSDYDNVLLAGDQELKVPGGGTHDLRSLYTDPFDLELREDAHLKVYIGNAWFNDEVKEPEPKPTVAK